MKTFLKILLFSYIFIIISAPCNAVTTNNNDFLAKDLLENKQAEEVNLVPDETEIQNNNPLDYLKNEEKEDIDDSLDNTEEAFKLFDTLWENKRTKESSFAEKILKSEIKRTDIPSFLLKDDFTFKYDKGPIQQLQFYGGYRGSISAIFNPHNYSTDYDNLTLETGLYGKFRNPDYSFKFMLKPLSTKGVSYVDQMFGDMYIVNTKIPNHKIIAGYSRVQTGVEGGASSFILPFAARSQIARNFGNARSLNIKLIGNYNYADYSIAYGSSGRYITSGMPGTEFTGNINFKPFGSHDGKFGKLNIGGGLNTGHNRINYTVGSVHVGYKHKKLWTTFEAAIADGYSGSKGISKDKAWGYAFTAGWKFNPHLQLIGRVDQFDPNRHKSHDLKREYTIGINWFIKGQALKFILNFVFCDNQNAKDSYKIILGTQIML